MGTGEKGVLTLGDTLSLSGAGARTAMQLRASDLLTHAVVVGMTGSGKTGLLTVLAEEALRAQVPVLLIDVKGDLTNLLLTFPTFEASAYEPWVGAEEAPRAAREREEGLRAAGIDETELRRYLARRRVRLVTPGSTMGEPLHVLSGLEHASTRWEREPEAARASLSAAISLVMRLLGRDADPVRSREHVLLSVLAERRLRAGQGATLDELMRELEEPGIDRIGALAMDDFFPPGERRELAIALNLLLASPTFAAWRMGSPLDPGGWLTAEGPTPLTVLSVAHLDDDERMLVLGVVLEELLSWVRTLPGTSHLRALVMFDEVFGFCPPHPAAPPTKRPLVALMKQARAFGVGLVLATQNPMDLDYRTLSNAGLWCIGRLQTDADRKRVVEGLGGIGKSATQLANVIKRLAPRWFVVRNVYAAASNDEPCTLMRPRCAMAYLRGPLTRAEVGRVVQSESGESRAIAPVCRDTAP